MQHARAVGAPGREALTVPLMMRAAYKASPPRLVVLLREPTERLHSAFYEYGQYRDRCPEGEEEGEGGSGRMGGRHSGTTGTCGRG
jgi:hypothetical protein